MPYYEFTCTNEECKEVQDDLVKMGTTEIPCKICGQPAKKSIGSFKFNAHGLPNGHIGVRITDKNK